MLNVRVDLLEENLRDFQFPSRPSPLRGETDLFAVESRMKNFRSRFGLRKFFVMAFLQLSGVYGSESGWAFSVSISRTFYATFSPAFAGRRQWLSGHN
jgi:hypothetical protein